MNPSSSEEAARHKRHRVLRWIYLCVLLLLLAVLFLRALGVLPGGALGWQIWALTLIALAALIAEFLRLPQSLNRLWFALILVVIILWLCHHPVAVSGALP